MFTRLRSYPTLDNPPDKDPDEQPRKTTKVETMQDRITKLQLARSSSQAINCLSQGIDGVWSDSDRVFNTFTDDASLGANGTLDGKA